MVKFKSIIAFLVLLAGSPALATTYYVKKTGSDSNNCTAAQSASTPKLTIASALACLGTGVGAGAGHTVEVWAGTYVETLDDVLPRGTSWNTPFTLTAKSGDAVTIAPTASGAIVVGCHTAFGEGQSWWAIVNGFIFDGTNSTDPNGVICIHWNHRIRISNNEFINTDFGSSIYTGYSGFLEIQNNRFHGGAFEGISGPGFAHAMYIEGSDNLVEGNVIYDQQAFGVHIYSSSGGTTSRNIVRNNFLYNGGLGRPVAAAIVALSGSDNQIYDNVIRDWKGSLNDGGMCIGLQNSSNKVYNNTCYDFTWIGIDSSGATSSTIKNNIVYTTKGTSGANEAIYGGGTISNNLCRVAGTNCDIVGNPLFVDATSNRFDLQVGSPAINAGTASIAAGITVSGNGNPDIGAFETFSYLNAEVGEVATNKVVVNFQPNIPQPVLITNSTGWTTTCGTVSSAAATGGAQVTLTLAAPWGGGACTVTYNVSTGNVTDSSLIGGTLNQRMLGFTTQTVTDNTGGAPSGSVALTHWRIYLLQGATDTVWTAKCAEDSSDCIVAPGSKLWVRGKLRNSSGSTYATFNLQSRWRYNGGSYTALTGSYVNSLKILGTSAQLGTVMSDGAATTADLLTSVGANIAGAVVRSANSIPQVALTNGDELEFAQAIDISTAAVVGDTYEMCAYRDDGTALTCATPVKLTIGSYQAQR